MQEEKRSFEREAGEKKRVFLLGDSIRFGAGGSPGYGRYVAEILKDRAEVFAPNDNCRFALYTLRYLHEWAGALGGQQPDVVHWNNGLWDVARMVGDEPLVSKEDYVACLKRVYARIKTLFPNAKVVFATTTPVIESWQEKNFFRRNDEIREYNDAAERLMRSLGVQVNDLYPVAEEFGEAHRADWVHFDETGSRILAKAVVSALEKAVEGL